jgi:hypothetical protein
MIMIIGGSFSGELTPALDDWNFPGSDKLGALA